jgi:hypothetical protein
MPKRLTPDRRRLNLEAKRAHKPPPGLRLSPAQCRQIDREAWALATVLTRSRAERAAIDRAARERKDA